MSRVNYSLTQLEYVLAVHKYGHFAKAAAACNVTQPTLSMQVQKLENDLGVIIFDRTKKPILLTETGKRMIEQFKAILFEAGRIEDIVKSTKVTGVQGELTLGIIPTIAPYLLPRLLPVLEKKYPAITLKILELQTSRIVESLDNDELDVGVLAIPLKSPRIIEQPLYFEPFSVLCKNNHELAHMKRAKYSSLKFDDIWLLEEGHCLRHQVLDVCSLSKERGKKRRFKFESGSLETLKNLINSYGGYTLLPALATDQIGRGSSLVQFEAPVPAREIGLVYRREHYKNELLRALAECILECIPADIRKIKQKNLDILAVG